MQPPSHFRCKSIGGVRSGCSCRLRDYGSDASLLGGGELSALYLFTACFCLSLVTGGWVNVGRHYCGATHASILPCHPGSNIAPVYTFRERIREERKACTFSALLGTIVLSPLRVCKMRRPVSLGLPLRTPCFMLSGSKVLPIWST